MDALSQYGSLKSLPPPSPETLQLNSLFSEMLQMRAEMAALKARPEADESLKSAKEELAAARAEIAELKTLVHALIGSVARAKGVNIAESDENSARLKKYVLEHLGGRGTNVHHIYLG